MSLDNSTLSIFFNSTLSTFANESQLKNKTLGRSYRASSSWGWWMLQIGTPLMMTTGLVGNLLSFIVLKSTRFRGKSYSHYLCTLAIFDSLVLVNKFIYRIDSLLIDTGRENIFAMFTDVACKIFNFGESVCHLMSTWLVLFMTIERFIAVRYPFKKDLLCRPRGVIIAILVVFSAMSYSQIYRLIMIESDRGACWASDRYRKVYLALYIYGYQGVMFLLPALLILIFNILIIANIRRLSSIEQSGCAFESNPRYAENKERRAKLYNKTTVVLLLISFMHLLTQLPHLILSLFIYGPSDRRRSMYWLSKLRGLGSVLECFSETNYASNFYIYVLSGTKFRSALRHMWARQSRTTRQTRPVKTERAFYFRKLPASS